MAFPNPWQNPEYYQKVKIGGRPIRALLVAINGNSIEDEWNEQRSTGSNSATYVFRGTKPAGPPVLTFEAMSPEDFDDLRDVYEMLAPVPSFTPNPSGNTQGSPGSSAYGKQYVQASSGSTATAAPSADVLLQQAQAALAALQSGAAAPAVTPSASTQVSILTPGPKPPTLSIENGFCAYVGITAVARKKWEGPNVTPTNSYIVKITFVPQRPVTKAAVGPASPTKPDNPGQQYMQSPRTPAAAAKAANQAAAKAAAR